MSTLKGTIPDPNVNKRAATPPKFKPQEWNLPDRLILDIYIIMSDNTVENQALLEQKALTEFSVEMPKNNSSRNFKYDTHFFYTLNG